MEITKAVIVDSQSGKIGTTKQDVTGFHGPTNIDMKIDNVDLEGSTNASVGSNEQIIR